MDFEKIGEKVGSSLNDCKDAISGGCQWIKDSAIGAKDVTVDKLSSASDNVQHDLHECKEGAKDCCDKAIGKSKELHEKAQDKLQYS
ncbi:hypothetical protein HDE_14438 [Halotydeus destructor]|nr:hypothetical protein HDE_14438 [Halotydeus destructor]